MKRLNIFTFGLFLIFLNSFAQSTHPNFELWNKHTDPIFYSITNSIFQAASTPLQELRAGKWTAGMNRDINQPTVIALALGKMPEPGQRIDVFTIKPGKTLFMRVGLPAEKEKFKETIKKWFGKNSYEGDNYIFGPQTGPLLGFKEEGLFSFGTKGLTERKHSLKNNFDIRDVTKSSVIYLPK